MADYYTRAELEAAQSQNILHYLQANGYGFKQEGHKYRSKDHSSLIVGTDGRWYWNSKDLKGSKPVELLKHLLINEYGYTDKDAYITAIKRLAGTEGQNLKPDSTLPKKNPEPPKVEENPDKGNIVLPPENKNKRRIYGYLCGSRKIDADIINDLIGQKKLYETAEHHNACFVSYDKDGKARHAYLRGTISHAERGFKKDIENSDKSFGLAYKGNPESTKVFCFENHIDALSHATLYKMAGMDYKDGHRISLHGTSFLGLEQFLKDNPQVTEIVSCMDNDETGRRRTQKMCEEYSEKGYKTYMQLSTAKDYNEQLVAYVTTLENQTEMAYEMEQ